MLLVSECKGRKKWGTRRDSNSRHGRIDGFWVPYRDETSVEVKIYGRRVFTVDHQQDDHLSSGTAAQLTQSFQNRIVSFLTSIPFDALAACDAHSGKFNRSPRRPRFGQTQGVGLCRIHVRVDIGVCCALFGERWPESIHAADIVAAPRYLLCEPAAKSPVAG